MCQVPTGLGTVAIRRGHNLRHTLVRIPSALARAPAVLSGVGPRARTGHVYCVGKFLTSMLEKKLPQR